MHKSCYVGAEIGECTAGDALCDYTFILVSFQQQQERQQFSSDTAPIFAHHTHHNLCYMLISLSAPKDFWDQLVVRLGDLTDTADMLRR